ncbi:anhydro-N-acetylmuramic acid kinase [Novispirillum sp. DQ9]|uniref:anhydro-N-acetylmuramic acid kinase n=1 Tax=Novispirillum sp. DQ9 TaxID=3398612 RepID=UPI003C7AD037
MASAPVLTAIGLMSGTSMDGIDAALIETDGERVTAFGPRLTLPYDPPFREALRGVLGETADPFRVAMVEAALTSAHVDAVEALLAAAGRPRVDVIGFHGHTVFHAPDRRLTRQIGDGAALARATGLRVVYDLRSADVAAGGQGAPLVPVYHRALAADLDRPLAVLNLGGVGNVTFLDKSGAPVAFDTGPGNALIDDWCARHTGQPIDRDGALAAAGTPSEAIIARLLAHPYFAAVPPKSLDRDAFGALVAAVGALSPADGAATLTAFTAASVAAARAHLPAAPHRWLVTGGGRLNPVLMEFLRRRLEAEVEPVEAVGWDGDALEAQAFAFLAVRHLRGLPQTWPTTTGCPAPMTGGRLAEPVGTARR